MRMRVSLVMVTMLALVVAVPGSSAVSVGEDIKIVCANAVLADLTENIVGDLATVEYIMPAGVCPAHFDARPATSTSPDRPTDLWQTML